MTIWRGFLITIASGMAFAFIGAAAGTALVILAPDYYRIVFRIPPGHPVDLAQLGLGLGITQGGGVGLITGLIIVVAVARYNSRAVERAAKPSGMA